MAETISVSGAGELWTALKTATAGTTIKLAAGNYGELGINAAYRDKWGHFDGEVTIRSADPKHPATFSDISLRGVENLTIDGVVVDYTLPKGLTGNQAYSQSAVRLQETANLKILNSVIDGDVLHDPGDAGNGLPIARGVYVRDSAGIDIDHNEIFNFYRAGVFSNNSDVTIRGNDIHTLRSDGLDFADVQDVVIENNHIHDFTTVPEDTSHRDMIQFWTNGTTEPSTGVEIVGNFLDSGGGVYTQSILMGNEAVAKGAGLDMYYRDVTVQNNVIYNAQAHGITVDEAVGVTITNNTVLHNPDSGDRGGISRPKINIDGHSRDVLVEHNITEAVVPGQPPAGAVGWTIDHNLLVQDTDPSKPNYYGDLFEKALAGGADTGLEALQPLAGSIIVKEGYGSSLTGGGSGGATGDGTGGGTGDGTGDGAPVVNSGDGAPVVNSGDGAPVVNSGDGAPVVNSGDGAPVVNSGDGAPVDSGDPVQLPQEPPQSSPQAAPEPSPEPSPASSPNGEILYRWNAGSGTIDAVDGGPDWVADAGAITGAARIAQ